jgi:hypothetical protein
VQLQGPPDPAHGDQAFGAGDVPPLSYAELSELPVQDLAQTVGAQYDVPADLILALGWVSTSLSPVDESHGECAPVNGWMGLRPAQLQEATALTGLSPEAIATEQAAALLGAAALLAARREELSPGASGQLADARWWSVIEHWPALGEAWLNQEFALAVFEVLQRGLEVRDANDALVVIDARELPGLADILLLPAPTEGAARESALHGYPGAHRFVAASPSNYSNRSAGLDSINKVVIHTTEGSYSGSIGWFRNSSSGVAAHYVVRKSDGEITQMVSDERRAWHAGSANARSIGIEHEGAAANSSTWTVPILESSARLSAWLSSSYDIPVDRTHFIGHSEVAGSSRSDPGPHFPWDHYIELVKCYRYGGSYCNGVDGGGADAPGSGSSGPGPGSSSGESAGCSGSSCGDGGPHGWGAGSDGPGSPGEAWVSFVEPRTGDPVANPVALRAERMGGPWIEFWAGAFRVGSATTDNPADETAHFFLTGTRTLSVRLHSSGGVLLDIDTISVDVRSERGEMTVYASPMTELTWRFSADVSDVTRPVEFVTYSVDGTAIGDDSSGDLRVTGAGFALTHSFDSPAAGSILVARAFDADSRLLASDTAILDGEGELVPQCALVGDLGCGDRIPGNTSLAPDASNRLDAYPDLPGNYSGPELGYQLDVSGAAEVEIRLVDPHPYIVNHDLVLLDAASGLCLADSYLQVGFNSLEFEPEPGRSYILVVDGYAGDAGAFELEVECR